MSEKILGNVTKDSGLILLKILVNFRKDSGECSRGLLLLFLYISVTKKMYTTLFIVYNNKIAIVLHVNPDPTLLHIPR